MNPDKYVHAKKIQCLKLNNFFFNQRKEMYVKEGYQYLSPFKNFIPTKTSMPKSFCV